MSNPAVVMNDQIIGTCAIHQIPSPTGSPMPAPPMPFASPLTLGLAPTVMITGKPAAVQGSSGYNTPPHVGLHPSDPYMPPPTQIGQVIVGSSTVMFEGKPAAYTGCQVTMCASLPGQIIGSGTTVMIGA
ncbi:MAG: PAAR domain-containing protein [Actinomycetota bacterium]